MTAEFCASVRDDLELEVILRFMREEVDREDTDESPDALDRLTGNIDEAHAARIDLSMSGVLDVEARAGHVAGNRKLLSVADERKQEAFSRLKQQGSVVLNPRAGAAQVQDGNRNMGQIAGRGRLEADSSGFPFLFFQHSKLAPK